MTISMTAFQSIDMRTFLIKRRQGYTLQCFLLELAARHTVAVVSQGFHMIDGEWVSYAAGQAALHSGTAVLVGGLLVGIVPPESANK
jgi:hypothetical protein